MDKTLIRKLLHDIESTFKQLRPQVIDSAGKSAVSIKEDGSEQTEMDVLVEQAILEMAQKLYPDIAFFGEESEYALPLPELCCLVDPIDGTKSYIQNIPGFTGMAVVIENGESVGSVIYDYREDTSYIAVKGEGAYKDGEKIHLVDKEVAQTIYCRDRMVEAVSQLEQLREFTIEKGNTGAGYRFNAIVDGSIAAHINAPHSPGGGFIHDYAPGTLLVTEAGGVVVPFNEEPYSVSTMSFVACHPALAEVFKAHKKSLLAIEHATLKT